MMAAVRFSVRGPIRVPHPCESLRLRVRAPAIDTQDYKTSRPVQLLRNSVGIASCGNLSIRFAEVRSLRRQFLSEFRNTEELLRMRLLTFVKFPHFHWCAIRWIAVEHHRGTAFFAPVR